MKLQRARGSPTLAQDSRPPLPKFPGGAPGSSTPPPIVFIPVPGFPIGSGMKAGQPHRLERPDAYITECMAVVTTRLIHLKERVARPAKAVETVNKILMLFERYGPIHHVIGHEAAGSLTRTYYITFWFVTSANQVYMSPSFRQENPHLKLESRSSIPPEYGDWLARFCTNHTGLPNDAQHLSSTHPSKKSVHLALFKATTTLNITPIPRLILQYSPVAE
ncbi:hypothetical protein DL93DRAFT_138602 [Clavulina sp. PMI_390]|nr:hypothetical protein DL93DRAFT_138602 [Clavulina sp. PMI_390]